MLVNLQYIDRKITVNSELIYLVRYQTVFAQLCLIVRNIFKKNTTFF